MQRDMKIGLVVGVALIGIVGALFFRREPEAKDKETPPPLQNAEELDRQIAGKAKAPYIKGMEDFAEPAAPVPPPQSGSTSKSKSADAYDVPGFLTKEDEARNRDMLTRKTGAVPDPIQGSKKEVAADAMPAHNREWEPTGPSARKAADSPRATPANSANGTGRTHVIQPGDTLSSLAARYLGSSARYHEIYDANRNVLKSPDALPDGKTIVIPDGVKVRDPHTAGTSSGAVAGTVTSASGPSAMKAKKAVQTVESDANDTPATPASQSDTPREKIRFVPINRGPFSAGRVQPAPGDSKSETKAGKKAAASDEDERD